MRFFFEKNRQGIQKQNSRVAETKHITLNTLNCGKSHFVVEPLQTDKTAKTVQLSKFFVTPYLGSYLMLTLVVVWPAT